MATKTLPNLVRSTAGAVPIVNEKGEITMQKVKVNRYVPGKRPEYAPESSESESSEDEEGFVSIPGVGSRDQDVDEEQTETHVDDPRLRRLRERQVSHGERRNRNIEEPEVLFEAEEEEQDREERPPTHHIVQSDSESEDEELDDDAIEQRREMMRQRARQKALEEDILDVGDEEEEERESEESSEYEEYSDSEDETGPRLKPVFVRKMDRVTIREREELEQEKEELEKERKKQSELRKRESHRLVATVIAEELQQEQGATSVEKVVNTDDENEEEEYEAWKVRELRRIKRDREERERWEKEKDETEKLRTMTEEERRSYLRINPRVVTNKAQKGKYKFLQKYYHRGVFYLDEESNVFTRDFAQPTLEDHFDKTVLPKVMQVKNFGRAGRTKYTHLVDQDTTQFDSPWAQANPINLKFQNRGGGTRQVFEKPSRKKRKVA